MKRCCQNWLDNNCQPKNPKTGKFKERQPCPKCGQKFEVEFEEIAVLGDDGNSEYQVVGADPIP